ncbi:MAG: hypothetical protein BWY28_01841 [bacterium ADurb.Bin236]|nr:MAG: hypothetical protein BWY28_01841 [bacterium ADurb.Bin236]HOY63601.1 HEAT repeat domain-containing protein [bacterium]
MTRQKARLKNLGFCVAGIGFLMLLFMFFATASWIGYEVKEVCEEAMLKYEGDAVEALIGLLEDDAADYRARNSAVWALGQLGDARALPAVKKHFKGYEKGARCDRGEELCQYELYKAVKLLEGGPNISAFVWR